MVNGAYGGAVVALVSLLTFACQENDPVRTLESASSEWAGERAASPEMFVIWRFRTRDCLGCSLPERDIRRIQSTYGDRIPFVAMHVGSEPDSASVINFLRTKRIDAKFVHLTENEHETLFDKTIPSVSIVAHGTVIWDSVRIRAATAA